MEHNVTGAGTNRPASSKSTAADSISHPSADETEEPSQATLSNSSGAFASPNLKPVPQPEKGEPHYKAQLELGRKQRMQRQLEESKSTLSALLRTDCSEAVKKSALLELAVAAQDENQLPRAQQILAQYMGKWPNDGSIPEILLRQGVLYRKMGASKLAISKFYAVLTSALVLKNGHLEQYQRAVLQAQAEIGDTAYLQGRFEEAAASYRRILKLDSPALNKAVVQLNLLRSLSMLNKHSEVLTTGNDFLTHFPESAEAAEVRFLLAHSYKALGSNSESLNQVLLLLSASQTNSAAKPAQLVHWQQRTGNEIANQLYREGDFLKALDIYCALAKLDSSPEWQLPVWYQIGLVFERLERPAQALDHYKKITSRDKDVPQDAAPSLKSVLEMARWRHSLLDWTVKNEAITRELQQGIAARSSKATPAQAQQN